MVTRARQADSRVGQVRRRKVGRGGGDLVRTFIPGASLETHDEQKQAGHHDAWCARYRAALRQLEQAGICVRPDQDDGAQQYSRLRQEWDPYVEHLARYMDYDMAVIDPATASACGGLRRTELGHELVHVASRAADYGGK